MNNECGTSDQPMKVPDGDGHSLDPSDCEIWGPNIVSFCIVNCNYFVGVSLTILFLKLCRAAVAHGSGSMRPVGFSLRQGPAAVSHVVLMNYLQLCYAV